VKVLLVNVPDEISRNISLALRVRWPDLSLLRANEASEALQLVHNERPHLAVLHLPDVSHGPASGDGFELIGEIRSFSSVPLIVVGQGDDVMDKVKALELGADDWLSAYSSPMEFIARVNAILRRCSPHKSGVARFLDGRLSIDYSTRRISVLGKSVRLTPIQYRIFCYLAENEGRICSNRELLRYVWGPNSDDDTELLKLNVYRLRSRIEEDPSNPEIIFNERGMGYVIRASASSD
jgi:two-component system, OmpR family, KDP operon response regulator KdpE